MQAILHYYQQVRRTLSLLLKQGVVMENAFSNRNGCSAFSARVAVGSIKLVI
jgi:hypothetical protein